MSNTINYKRVKDSLDRLNLHLYKKGRELAPTVHPKPTKRSNEIARKRIQRQLDLDPRFRIDDEL